MRAREAKRKTLQESMRPQRRIPASTAAIIIKIGIGILHGAFMPSAEVVSEMLQGVSVEGFPSVRIVIF
jgi:hypothetical protein